MAITDPRPLNVSPLIIITYPYNSLLTYHHLSRPPSLTYHLHRLTQSKPHQPTANVHHVPYRSPKYHPTYTSSLSNDVHTIAYYIHLHILHTNHSISTLHPSNCTIISMLLTIQPHTRR